MNDDELLSRVRELRERGLSPKQVAGLLGLRPSAVAPLVRRVAEAEQSKVDPAERAVLGCWINPGWSSGLGLDDAPDWAASDPHGESEPHSSGLVGVMIARQERGSRATVCGFLVDVFCLGVKNAMGPTSMSTSAVSAHSNRFFTAFSESPRPVPLELAQHLVHGAVAYARSLGFEPHPDFAATAPYLGVPTEPTPIRFGRDGVPFYISGPNDDPRAVMSTLTSTAGSGNFQFVTHL